MTKPRTYLDYNATAPLRPEARASMIATLDLVGNASSVHTEGRRARAAIETAREQVAALVGAKPEQVVFTSGATEANNWALSARWDQIILSGIEHESVLVPARASGSKLVEVGCGADGQAIVADIAALVGDSVNSRKLLTMQAANSETGVLQPIARAAELAGSRGCVVHCDAVQAAGRTRLDMNALGVDLMSLSAHKMGGPKGVGALVIADTVDLPAFIKGGSQERRRRAGTENIAAIAGFGAAAVIALREAGDTDRIAQLRNQLEAGVIELTPSAVVIGAASPRLPNTSCIAIPGGQAAMLLIKLDLAGLAVSAGSACSSGKVGGSHVLAAMGIDKRLADSAIRISLGNGTTAADIGRFLSAWAQIHLRPHDNDGSPVWRSGRHDITTPSAAAPATICDLQAGE